MTRKTCLVLSFLLIPLLGCTTDRKKEDTEMDQLWRSGFGYNNPNPQRQRDDLPPVNLDGSVHRD